MDSIYKIFTTLEKVSKGREVEIFIEPEHPLFDNLWRGKQLKEIVEDRSLQAVFSAKNNQSQEYYRQVGLQVEVIKQRNIEKLFSIVSLFLFDIKKFHLHAYETKKYLFGLMIGLEVLVGVVFLFAFVSLIFPSAVVYLYPAEEREQVIYNFRYYPHENTEYVQDTRFLSIPYYTASLDYKYDLTISVANLQYFINPAKGKIQVFNTLPISYSLVANTQFVTEDGVIFRALNGFEVATGSRENPSVTEIMVQAMDKDMNGEVVGIRGNVGAGTRMWIRNLEESASFKQLRGVSVGEFYGGSTTSVGSVTQEDIAALTGKLVEQAYHQKLDVVAKNLGIQDGILLPFDSLIRTTFTSITGDRQTGADASLIKGSAYVTYTFHYVLGKDLFAAFHTYLDEHSSSQQKFLSVDTGSLSFIKDTSSSNTGAYRQQGDVYIITTKIDVLQGYDFAQDGNRLLVSLKNLISGLSVDEARRLISSEYAEVGSVDIKVSPFWYQSIPAIKSRIRLQVF